MCGGCDCGFGFGGGVDVVCPAISSAQAAGNRLPACAASVANSHDGKLCRRVPSFSEAACLMSLAIAGAKATADRASGCAAGVSWCEWPCGAVMHGCAVSMGCLLC